jgi:hypothetical protein
MGCRSISPLYIPPASASAPHLFKSNTLCFVVFVFVFVFVLSCHLTCNPNILTKTTRFKFGKAPDSRAMERGASLMNLLVLYVVASIFCSTAWAKTHHYSFVVNSLFPSFTSLLFFLFFFYS